ncbi:hypothetical protein MKW92_015113, partial [Papaver armeniacum]
MPRAPLPPKEEDMKLSKKELKKKELAELDAVLAELGIDKKETDGQDESHGNLIICFYALCFNLFYLLLTNGKPWRK